MKKKLANITAAVRSKGLAIYVLVAVLALPSRFTSWFDGLPWSTPIEFSFVVVILPFLFLLNRDFISKKLLTQSLFFLLVIRLITLATLPANGLELRAYSSEERMQADVWERTYTTLLNPRVSEVFVREYENKLEFPIEWGNDRAYEPSKLWLGLRISGVAQVPDNYRLAVIATGLNDGRIQITDSEGTLSEVPIFKATDDIQHIASPNAVSQGRIEGEFTFEPEQQNWSLIPIVIFPDGEYEVAHRHNVFWQDESITNIPSLWLTINQVLAITIDLCILLLLISWFVYGARMLLPGLWWLFGIGAVSAISSFVLINWQFEELLAATRKLFGPFGEMFIQKNYLAVWIVVAGAMLIIWQMVFQTKGKYKSLRSWKLILITFAPLVLVFYLHRYWVSISQVEFMSRGDDWLTYQNFAR